MPSALAVAAEVVRAEAVIVGPGPGVVGTGTALGAGAIELAVSIGGIILGVAQAIGAQLDPGWQLLAGHIAFLVVLALRPEGLFPTVS